MLSSFSFDNNHSKPKKLFHQIVGRRLLKTARLHFTAQAEQNNSPELGRDGFILPNIVNTASGLSFKETKNGTFTVVTLSRLHPVKNLESLFKAVAQLPFIVKVNIIGDGELYYVEELKKLAEQLDIHHNISWKGSLYGDEKYRCLAAADLMVLPSYTENFAIAVIESLSSGTPVLVSNEVGISSYVLEKGLGWTCGTSAESIAQALLEISSKKEDLVKIRDMAPVIVEKDFSPMAVASKYVEMYKRHLAR